MPADIAVQLYFGHFCSSQPNSIGCRSERRNMRHLSTLPQIVHEIVQKVNSVMIMARCDTARRANRARLALDQIIDGHCCPAAMLQRSAAPAASRFVHIVVGRLVRPRLSLLQGGSAAHLSNGRLQLLIERTMAASWQWLGCAGSCWCTGGWPGRLRPGQLPMRPRQPLTLWR